MRSISATLAAPMPMTAQRRMGVEMLGAGLGREDLGIVDGAAQRPRHVLEIEDDGGGDDGTGERPAPGLVDAADEPARFVFEREIRHDATAA